MIYRIVLDGNDILNYADRDFVLLDPKLNMEINTAGSLEFTMPPCHAFYNAVQPITSTVEVFESDMLLWFGRPVEFKVDLHTQRKVYCEGALAFFNDTVQRPQEYDQVSLHDFFRAVIAAHNQQVGQSRQFTVGRITLPDNTIYRKTNYETTFAVLKKQCVGAEGGYLFLRREQGVNYIDWLAAMPYTSNQPVEFGLNLLNMTSGFDGSSIATCVLPLGDKDRETGLPITVAAENDGSDVIESEAVATYGRITRTVSFSGVKDAQTLYAAGQEYLQNQQFDDLVIECTAGELHFQNQNYAPFRIGQMIHCRSVPHLVDRTFPLMKLSLRLDTAAKQITLGTAARQTLTRIYKSEQGSSDDSSPENPATEQEINELNTRVDIAEGRLDNMSSASSDGYRHWIGTLSAYRNLTSINSATLYFIIPG